MIDKGHPLFAIVRLVGEYSYADSRLIADGNFADYVARARDAIQRQHYFHGLLQGSQAVLILYWLSSYSRSPSAYVAVWAVVSATTLGVDLWWWRKRRRALAVALAHLERDLTEHGSDAEVGS